MAPNGKIYGIPRGADKILVIDPETNNATLHGDVTALPDKWVGGVLAPNGKIYGMPKAASQVLVIDPRAGRGFCTSVGLSAYLNRF